MIQATSTREVKRELGRRIEMVRRPEFLDGRIRPYLAAQDEANGSWETDVLQLDGTGAATLEINIGDQKVFGKFYPGDNGPLIYEKLKALRAGGFGPDDRYQVVEPLGFIPEYGMLLTRGVDGPPVSEAIGVDDEAFLSGVRESARWVARLHACPVRIGKPRSLLESSEVLSVVRRLAKVMTRHPAHLERAVAMVRQMEELAEDTVDGLLVQTHGQYRPIHVFISDSSVAVIDLDRSRPCDPSRDVAEFVHRLRVMMYRDQGTVERAEAPTRAFLETYASEIPDRSYLTNLRFHWSRYVFHSLSKELKDSESTDLESGPSAAFYRSEFENVIQDRYGVREA
jgi:hypothetical protein